MKKLRILCQNYEYHNHCETSVYTLQNTWFDKGLLRQWFAIEYPLRQQQQQKLWKGCQELVTVVTVCPGTYSRLGGKHTGWLHWLDRRIWHVIRLYSRNSSLQIVREASSQSNRLILGSWLFVSLGWVQPLPLIKFLLSWNVRTHPLVKFPCHPFALKGKVNGFTLYTWNKAQYF